MSDFIKQSSRDHDRNPVRPFIRRGGGGSATCKELYRLRLYGNPTSGDLALTVGLLPVEPAFRTETLLIPYNAIKERTPEERSIELIFEAHQGWDDDFVITAEDGPWPNQALTLKFSGGLSVSTVTLQVNDAQTTLAGGARNFVEIFKATSS